MSDWLVAYCWSSATRFPRLKNIVDNELTNKASLRPSPAPSHWSPTANKEGGSLCNFSRLFALVHSEGQELQAPQIATFLFHFLWNWLAAYYSTYVYIIEIYHVGYVLLTSHMPPQTKFYIRHVRSGPCRLGILTWPAGLADTGYKVKPIVHSVFRTRNRVEYNARLTSTPVQPPASISLVVCHVISAFEKALWIIHLSW